MVKLFSSSTRTHLLLILFPLTIWMQHHVQCDGGFKFSILQDISFDTKVLDSKYKAIKDGKLVSKYAVATFMDTPEHVYGIYSIKQQMGKYAMEIPLVTVTHEGFIRRNPKLWKKFNDWFPSENIHLVNRKIVTGKVGVDLWKGTFNKLHFFNLTQYDKLITLDQDVLIRTNLMHWFDFPAPCAVQAGNYITWNSGAMVIAPNKTLFNDLVQGLPSMHASRKHPRNESLATPDNMNSQQSDQGYLAAYFTQLNHTRMCTLPTEFAALTSSFGLDDFQYFLEHRRHLFETVHFTLHKPWRRETSSKDPILCDFFAEFRESVKDLHQHGLAIRNDYMRDCPIIG